MKWARQPDEVSSENAGGARRLTFRAPRSQPVSPPPNTQPAAFLCSPLALSCHTPPMRRRTRVFITVAGLAVLVAVVTLLSPDSEPRFEGRSLCQWVRASGRGERAASERAFRAIGTNAVPTLLYWIRYEPSPLGRTVHTLAERLPGPLRPNPTKSRGYRATDAVIGFSLLGPEGRIAVPELVHLTMTSTTEGRIERCVEALCNLGPVALPGLLTIITNTQAKGRVAAIHSIGYSGTNFASAVPFLIKCLDDEEDGVACTAATTLGRLALSPSTVIPALAATLRSTNADCREYAAAGLLDFGAKAMPAVSALQAALLDPSPSVRVMATNALLEIAPNALTNAAPP